MKKTYLNFFVVGIWLSPSVSPSQSTVAYEANSSVEVQTGADVSADNIITNSNYSGGGTFNRGPLPVTMSTMSVQTGKNTATIVWRTESETENYGFEVERRKMEDGSWKMGDGNETTNQRQDEATNQRQNASTNQRLSSPTWITVGFVPGAGTSLSPREYSFVDKPDQPGRYAYRIKQIDHSGAFTYTSTLEVLIGFAPLEFTLSQNYPNPFNPTTTIEFTLPEDGRVKLRIYNILGEEVFTLVDEDRKAGVYQQIVFDASRLVTGVYISRLEFKDKQLIKKMLLLK